MAKLEGASRDVLNTTEFVAIVTSGADGPHLVAAWGDYFRALGIGEETLMIPVGAYQTTEENLRQNDHVQVIAASSQVTRDDEPGAGCLLTGRAKILCEGELAEVAKTKFPWARGVMVIHIDNVQLEA